MFSYSEIRKFSPIGEFRSRFLVDHICMRISPFFSALFIEKKVKPNTITMFMIISGVVGAILFALPSTAAKILGIIGFYLWYIFDCSDGEVARITKTYSKYGREMDYMAHLICHPLMNLALFLSYVQLDKYNLFLLAIIFIISISTELITRMIIMFSVYLDNGSNRQLGEGIGFIKYLLIQISIYPNFILLFPLFYFLDYFFNIDSIYLLLIFIGIHTVITIQQLMKKLFIFYHS